MSPINPDGTWSHPVQVSLLSRLMSLVAELTSNPLRLITLAFGTLLMAFATATVVWQIWSGWIVGSSVVPITFMAGLVATRLAVEVSW